MPKISAATIVQHRAQQERLILDAAHAILEETGDVTSMREVAERAGLARSSVYHYFGSREALLNALVQDVFPKWTERVTNAMAAEPEPSGRIIAYALANVQLVEEGAHAVGSALAALSPGEALNEQATQMHRAIQEPLIETLTELGVQNPEGLGELINSVIHASTRLLESGQQPEQVYAGLTAVIGPMAREMQSQKVQEIKGAQAAEVALDWAYRPERVDGNPI
ncbi:TetR/AcrR family transcriptional regulator [Leucobacter denitrificans]|uniref:TetR/AcrR family transcriptional regulator n=1 Tax=Leucobacter denitrificans TaxID=683042 RepID=A0A7G9S528_9MICO|nr:TetR/AcrR family transcriptional regulator [Leucobacter denitrificans]QNN62953.1 TetR/AcrR family transcriptional regulator [Leucobacter denitrificans]